MINKIKAIFFFTWFACTVYGQTNAAQAFIDQGIKLYEDGDYKGAVEQYKKALKADKESLLANYEISMAYFALKDYDKAIDHSDVVIDAGSTYVDKAYVLKGSALDLLGKPKDALKTYKKAIKKFPDSYLLHYNLALTAYNLQEYEEAEVAVKNGLKINPAHASSHLLLGSLMKDQGSRIKSLLALYNFLLLEPEGARAKIAYQLLELQLKKGVTKTGENSTNITLTMGKESDEFSAIELMLSLLEASKTLEENKGKTEYELFAENTQSFFSTLGEMKGENKGFWWDYYVDFFYAMTKEKHVEVFSYYILQVKEDKKVSTWLTEHKDQMSAFSEWYANFEQKF